MRLWLFPYLISRERLPHLATDVPFCACASLTLNGWKSLCISMANAVRRSHRFRTPLAAVVEGVTAALRPMLALHRGTSGAFRRSSYRARVCAFTNTCCSGVLVAVLAHVRLVAEGGMGVGLAPTSVAVLPDQLRSFAQSSVVESLLLLVLVLGLVGAAQAHMVHGLPQRSNFLLLHPSLPTLHVCGTGDNVGGFQFLARGDRLRQLPA